MYIAVCLLLLLLLPPSIISRSLNSRRISITALSEAQALATSEAHRDGVVDDRIIGLTTDAGNIQVNHQTGDSACEDTYLLSTLLDYNISVKLK